MTEIQSSVRTACVFQIFGIITFAIPGYFICIYVLNIAVGQFYVVSSSASTKPKITFSLHMCVCYVQKKYQIRKRKKVHSNRIYLSFVTSISSRPSHQFLTAIAYSYTLSPVPVSRPSAFRYR